MDLRLYLAFSRTCTTRIGSSAARVAYVRTVKTSSGATAVQIVWSWHKGSRSIEHLGSAPRRPRGGGPEASPRRFDWSPGRRSWSWRSAAVSNGARCRSCPLR